MTSAVQRFIGFIHARADHFPSVHYDTSNRSFSKRKSFLSHVKSLLHKMQMDWQILPDLGRQAIEICRSTFFVRQHERARLGKVDLKKSKPSGIAMIYGKAMIGLKWPLNLAGTIRAA